MIRDGGFSIYEYALEDDILSGEGVPFCHCKERSDSAIYFSVLLKIVIASLTALAFRRGNLFF